MTGPSRRRIWIGTGTVLGIVLCAGLALTLLDRPGPVETAREPALERRVTRGSSGSTGTGRHAARQRSPRRRGGLLASHGGEGGPLPAVDPTANEEQEGSATAVTFYVSDAADGKPIADRELNLRLTSDSGPSSRVVQTDGEGSFGLPGVTPGLYAVELRHPHFLVHSQALEVPGPEDEVPTVQVDLVRGGTLRGVVLAKEGGPIRGAQVLLSRQEVGGPARARATSDGEGRFALRALREGLWTLTITKTGRRAAGPLELEVPRQSPLELTLIRDRAVTVQAMTEDGGPLGGAQVRAQVAGMRASILPLAPSTTDDQGIARLRGLPYEGAEILLRGKHPGFPPTNLAVPLDVLLEGETRLVFRPAGVVGGAVVNPDGEPIGDANVHLTGPVEKRVKSTSTGEFLFGKLPPGAYTVRAVSSTLGSSAPASFDVTGGQEVFRELVVKAGPGSVGGTIVDADGGPLALVPIVVEGSGVKLTRPSARDGSFRFEGLPVGAYRVLAGSHETGTAVRETVSTGTEDLVLTIEPPGSITGVVDFGGPASGFAIQVLRSHPEGTAGEVVRTYRFSSNRPYFKLGGIPPGSYGLVVLQDGLRTSALDAVDVLPGSRTGPLLLAE